jgi:hypothetical protein
MIYQLSITSTMQPDPACACSYSFYLAVMYIMFIALLSVIALSAYVGWSMQNNRLDSKWWVQDAGRSHLLLEKVAYQQ